MLSSTKPFKLLAVIIFTLLAACGVADANDQAPQLNITQIDGKPFSLEQNKGKVTVVEFWATWCPVCVREMPAMQKFYDDNKAKGLQWIAVSIDDDDMEVHAFLDKNKYTLPFAWRGKGKDNFGKLKGTPTVVVIGKDGTVKARYVGGVKEAQLAEIKAML